MKLRNVIFLTSMLIVLYPAVLWAAGARAPDLPTALPRNETLYINGMIWGPPTNFNPLATNSVFPVDYGPNMMFTYETLFMYNQLTNQSEPLLGLSHRWVDPLTLRVELHPAARWSDGTPLTAADVAYSYLMGKRYPAPWAAYLNFIADVVADGDRAVLIRMSPENPNPLFVLDSLNRVYIIPRHIWEPKERASGNDFTKIVQEFNPNPIGSGPYKVMFYDDTRVVAIRDDNYWGRAIFGRLPAPKYIAHIIFKSNDAGNSAFRQGEVDISQQFISRVWDLWRGGEPFKTYLDAPPYYLPGVIPHLIFNMTRKGIGDNADVRRALALAIDYKRISEVAMSGYSGEIIPGITLPVEAEKGFVDQDAVKALQFTHDVDAANRLLDTIGARRGSDGIRVLRDGTRLGPWVVSCPFGWSDWNAALEIVVHSGRAIGMDLRTEFPEFPTWQRNMQLGNFDMGMWFTTPPGVAQPWDRARDKMDSTGVPPIGTPLTVNTNWGRFRNARVDELLRLIPRETDPGRLRVLYTELNTIFLRELPIIPLMYRPSWFYTVYEGVWTGFPDSRHNPRNIPPTPFMGAFIRVLYNIRTR